MALNKEIEEYIRSSQDELKQLIRDLCKIPAPSHHEDKRAKFCKEWFEKNGGKDVVIDEAKNVICPYNVKDDGDIIVIMAHMDTVFPDLEPMPFREEGGMMYCPGVTDDTANLAVMMMSARYIIQHEIPTKDGILFAANSCEEGLGNLKGSRAIVERYGGLVRECGNQEKYGRRIKEFITLDGTDLESIVTKAVGSHRYKVSVETEGGHSFRDFGNRNAIQVISSLIDKLYQIEVPHGEGHSADECGKIKGGSHTTYECGDIKGGSHTTYNVGLISGGTSVNTIAQSAEILYEYRSNDKGCLEKMKDAFMKAVSDCTSDDAKITVEMIGERPCSSDVDEAALLDLIRRGENAVREATGSEPVLTSGSTDCNIPLSKGIPAICLGVCVGGNCHTREEWLDTSSLEDGTRLFMEFFQNYKYK